MTSFPTSFPTTTMFKAKNSIFVLEACLVSLHLSHLLLLLLSLSPRTTTCIMKMMSRGGWDSRKRASMEGAIFKIDLEKT